MLIPPFTMSISYSFKPPRPLTMRSCLTRQIFQCILQNKPLPHIRCLNYSSAHVAWRKPNARAHSRSQTRCIFNFSFKPKPEPKIPGFDPGQHEMMELGKSLHINIRPPSVETLVTAFNQFFQECSQRHRSVEEAQALHARVTFQYLQKHSSHKSGSELTVSDMMLALHTLKHPPHTASWKEHRRLAELLFEEVNKRSTLESGYQYHRSIFTSLKCFTIILAKCGDSLYARQLVVKFWEENPTQREFSLWTIVLTGLCQEKNDEEMLQTITIMERYGIPFDRFLHENIIKTYAKVRNLASIKRWYNHPIANGDAPTLSTHRSVLEVCAYLKDFDWGQPIFQIVLSSEPSKQSWDIIFQWVAARGRGVDEIERMMEVMVRRNEEQGKTARPDIETINGLIKMANYTNDPYTAERYVSLAQKWNMVPDAHTFVLQLECRLQAGDLDGAKVIYTRLQEVDVPLDKYGPLLNKLILSLCRAREQNYDHILTLVDDLNNRNLRLELDTISALGLLHLNRNELHSIIDLLQTNANQYGIDQRAILVDNLVSFCLDRTKSTTQAWDVYSILRHIFPETDNTTRIKLMNEFYARKRSDMALHVFAHMRQQSIKENRPDGDAYTQCLEGIAKTKDASSLDTIHNMLRLDTEVEPDTKLNNALMLAFTACEQPSRSLEFWDDIVYSREGPTYNSIQIALQACETASNGERYARGIWARLQKFEVEITREIYIAYIGALTGHALLAEAIQLIDDMEKQIGCQPDALSLVHG